MKKEYVLFFVLLLSACNINPGPEELKSNLKSTMTDFLYKGVNYDSSKVKYAVEDVIYYEEKKQYDCEFKVKMTGPGLKDTTGTMRAYISKDFKTVKRNY